MICDLCLPNHLTQLRVRVRAHGSVGGFPLRICVFVVVMLKLSIFNSLSIRPFSFRI